VAKNGPRVEHFVLNCVPSTKIATDWGFQDAVAAGVVDAAPPPASKDLRASWWAGHAVSAKEEKYG